MRRNNTRNASCAPFNAGSFGHLINCTVINPLLAASTGHRMPAQLQNAKWTQQNAQRPNFRRPIFQLFFHGHTWWGVWHSRYSTCECSSCCHHPCYHGDGYPARLSEKRDGDESEMKVGGLCYREKTRWEVKSGRCLQYLRHESAKNGKNQVSFFLSARWSCESKGGANKTKVVTEVEEKMVVPVVPNTVKPLRCSTI